MCATYGEQLVQAGRRTQTSMPRCGLKTLRRHTPFGRVPESLVVAPESRDRQQFGSHGLNGVVSIATYRLERHLTCGDHECTILRAGNVHVTICSYPDYSVLKGDGDALGCSGFPHACVNCTFPLAVMVDPTVLKGHQVARFAPANQPDGFPYSCATPPKSPTTVIR